MGGRERKYTPRPKHTANRGAPHGQCTARAGLGSTRSTGRVLVYSRAPFTTASPKSALGQATEGGILLTPEEVMFCHWYRHVPLPGGPEWFEQRLEKDEELAKRTIALDVLRNGGERVVPALHLQERFSSLPGRTWAVRWERHEPWTSHHGFSQIRLQRTNDALDWKELSTWVQNVLNMNHVAELCVIDEEFDTTVYHLSMAQPNGNQLLFSIGCEGAKRID